jgi:hypothetical protein
MQIVANRPHHHFARVEPHPDLYLQPIGPAHLIGIVPHCRLHGQGGVTGTGGMIFVGDWRTKQGHNTIAQYLVHRALKAVNGVHHGV